MKKFKCSLIIFCCAAAFMLSCQKEGDSGKPDDQIAVTGVSLNSTSLTMTEGETSTLSATITPSNATNKSVIWSSDNSSVATVEKGTVTAKSAGSAIIMVKTDDGGKTATCLVNVNAKTIAVTGVTLDKTSIELKEGETYALNATVSPENATNKKVVWSSSDENIASVDETGKITAISMGNCYINVIAEDGNYTAKCNTQVIRIINLSSKETANSYIVPCKQDNNIRYSFSMSCEGNSDAPLTGTDASLVWQTCTAQQGIDKIEFILDSCRVYFSPASIESNALLALKNSSNEIVWSWHIWTTNYNPDTDFCTMIGGDILMKKNLGATSNSTCLYQWGRKDPMLVTGYKACYDTTTLTYATGTLAYANSHPTTFIINNYDIGSGDWNWEHSSYWSESKTKFDPCPPGWRVMGPPASFYRNIPDTLVLHPDRDLLTFPLPYSTPEIDFEINGMINFSDGIYWGGDVGANWFCDSFYSRFICAHTLSFTNGNTFEIKYEKNSGSAVTWGRSIRCQKDN